MKLVFLLFPVYACVVLLVLLVPVRINLFFVRENKDDFLALRVNTFFSLLRFSVEIPLLRRESPFSLTMEAELKTGEEKLLRERKESLSLLSVEWRKMRAHLRRLYSSRKVLTKILSFIARTVAVEKFVCRLACGTGDAALTGLAVGSFWAFAGSMLALLQQYLRFATKPELTFRPLYTRAGVDLYLDAEMSFRIGHLALAALMFLFTKSRGGK
ncbi:MAG: DUF2953 domain-containing protein [Firmicutes bacterium]|nr:DUF2953 domain-containing protein [Bacillota bacterium]